MQFKSKHGVSPLITAFIGQSSILGLMSLTILVQGMAGLLIMAHTSVKSYVSKWLQVLGDTASTHFSTTNFNYSMHGMGVYY